MFNFSSNIINFNSFCSIRYKNKGKLNWVLTGDKSQAQATTKLVDAWETSPYTMLTYFGNSGVKTVYPSGAPTRATVSGLGAENITRYNGTHQCLSIETGRVQYYVQTEINF